MGETDQRTAITIRFFRAIDVLKQKRKLRGLQTFTRAYGLNYWNMSTLRKEPNSHPLRPEWLAYLVIDYGISATYLLTGVGPMFVDSEVDDIKNATTLTSNGTEP